MVRQRKGREAINRGNCRAMRIRYRGCARPQATDHADTKGKYAGLCGVELSGFEEYKWLKKKQRPLFPHQPPLPPSPTPQKENCSALSLSAESFLFFLLYVLLSFSFLASLPTAPLLLITLDCPQPRPLRRGGPRLIGHQRATQPHPHRLRRHHTHLTIQGARDRNPP